MKNNQEYKMQVLSWVALKSLNSNTGDFIEIPIHPSFRALQDKSFSS